MKALVTIASLALATPAMATAHQVFGGVNITSWHIGAPAGKYNSNNRGLYAGLRWGDRVQYGFEGGFFQNSYDVQSTYLLGFVDFPIAQLGEVELRAGAWAGLFEYPDFVLKAYGTGLPVWGDYIGVPGLSLTARHGRTDVQLKVTRGLSNTNAIVTAQIGRAW